MEALAGIGSQFQIRDDFDDVVPAPMLQHRGEEIVPIAEMMIEATLGDAEIARQQLNPNTLDTFLGQNIEGEGYPSFPAKGLSSTQSCLARRVPRAFILQASSDGRSVQVAI